MLDETTEVKVEEVVETNAPVAESAEEQTEEVTPSTTE
jgi:hypothetical protein